MAPRSAPDPCAATTAAPLCSVPAWRWCAFIPSARLSHQPLLERPWKTGHCCLWAASQQPGASQMPVRCRSDAGQMPVRCRSDTGQMPVRCRSDAGQMPIRCRSDAGQMPVRCQIAWCSSTSCWPAASMLTHPHPLCQRVCSHFPDMCLFVFPDHMCLFASPAPWSASG